jgi:hypothetical protein
MKHDKNEVGKPKHKKYKTTTTKYEKIKNSRIKMYFYVQKLYFFYHAIHDI